MSGFIIKEFLFFSLLSSPLLFALFSTRPSSFLPSFPLSKDNFVVVFFFLLKSIVLGQGRNIREVEKEKEREKKKREKSA